MTVAAADDVAAEIFAARDPLGRARRLEDLRRHGARKREKEIGETSRRDQQDRGHEVQDDPNEASEHGANPTRKRRWLNSSDSGQDDNLAPPNGADPHTGDSMTVMIR
jgi:hypothetical protein